MEYQKKEQTSDNVPRFIIKNGYNFMISQILLKIEINQVNKYDLKHQY